MRTHTALTKEQFDQLLAWLSPDPNLAAEKYEVIRAGLVQRFISRHFPDAEFLADETINRVASKVKDLAATYEGDPAGYFHAVAKNVVLEYARELRSAAKPPPPEPEPLFDDVYFDCLEECLKQLPPEKQTLILAYYSDIRRAKIDSRKKMRQQLQLKANALRAQTHRVRKKLSRCVRECVGRSAERNGIV